MARSIKPSNLAYGMDVEWKAGDIVAFREYGRLCTIQAKAAFAANVRGDVPVIVPAAELAAHARAFAASQVQP